MHKKITLTVLSFFFCFTSCTESRDEIIASVIIGLAHGALNNENEKTTINQAGTFIAANFIREKISSSCGSAITHALTQSFKEWCVKKDPPFSPNTTWLVAGWKCLSPLSGDSDKDED